MRNTQRYDKAFRINAVKHFREYVEGIHFVISDTRMEDVDDRIAFMLDGLFDQFFSFSTVATETTGIAT